MVNISAARAPNQRKASTQTIITPRNLTTIKHSSVNIVGAKKARVPSLRRRATATSRMRLSSSLTLSRRVHGRLRRKTRQIRGRAWVRDSERRRQHPETTSPIPFRRKLREPLLGSARQKIQGGDVLTVRPVAHPRRTRKAKT